MAKRTSMRALGTTLVAAVALLVSAGAATAAPPSVGTKDASGVSSNSAKLNGTVDPNNEATTWYFEFGASTGYGTKTTVKSAGSGNKAVNASTTISGLAAGTTYHYRLVASNGSGTTFGSDESVTTDGPPTVVTGAPQSIAPSTVTLTGSVDPRGEGTSWQFEYGTTTAYGSKTKSKNAGSKPGSVAVDERVKDLTPGTTYHYRLIASSKAGKATGADATFVTTQAVTLSKPASKVVAGRYVTLSGTSSGAQPGSSVTVLARPFGTNDFAQVATVLTGGGGTWTYLAKPRIATTYRASANGGTSATFTVGVRPAVSLRLVTKARFSTRVTGASGFTGKLVKLQRRANGRWVTVKQKRLNARSVALFPASLLPHGRSAIRIAMSVNQAGPGYLGGLSRTLSYTRK
jgi:hypothetical protein